MAFPISLKTCQEYERVGEKTLETLSSRQEIKLLAKCEENGANLCQNKVKIVVRRVSRMKDGTVSSWLYSKCNVSEERCTYCTSKSVQVRESVSFRKGFKLDNTCQTKSAHGVQKRFKHVCFLGKA
jgi:hypothetical protein